MAEKKELILSLKITGTTQQNAELNKLEKNLILLRKRQSEVNKQLRNGIPLSSRMRKEYKTLSTNVKATSTRVNELKKNILVQNGVMKKTTGLTKNITAGFKNMALQFVGVMAAFALIKGTIKIFSDFEQASADLAAVLGKTRSEIKELAEDAKRLGGITKFTATEVLALSKEFAKLGFSTREILDATEATLSLAAATNTELAEAARVAGATVRGFGLDASETQRVVDVMAKSFSNSALDMDKFSVSMGKLAPVAKAVGLTIEDVTGFMGTLADAGIEASTIGTSLRKVFIELSRQGLTLDEALAQINNSQDKLNTAQKIFGIRAATTALVMADNIDKAAELTTELNNAGGAAKKMADEQLDTLIGKSIILKSAWEGFILSMEDGEGFISEILQGTITALTSLLQEMAISFKSVEEIRAKIASDNLSEQAKEDIKEFERFLEVTKVNTKSTIELTEARDRFLRLNRERLTLIKDLTSADESEIESLIERIDTINKFVITAAKQNAAIKETTLLTAEEIEAQKKAVKDAEEALKENAKIREKFAEERRIALLTEEQQGIDKINKRAEILKKAGIEEVEIEKFVLEERSKIRDEFRKNELAEQTKAIDEKEKFLDQELKAEINNAKLTIDDKKKLDDKIRELRRKRVVDGLALIALEIEGLTASTEKTIELKEEENNALIEKQIELNEALIELEIEDKELKNEQEALDDEAELLRKEEIEEGLSNLAINAAQDLANTLFAIAANKRKAELKAALKIIKEDTKSEKDKAQAIADNKVVALQKELDLKIISQKEFDDELVKIEKNLKARFSEIDKKAAADTETERKKAFEKQKKTEIAMIAINAAVAVIKALSQLGPIAGALAAVGIAITAGLQVAAINSEEFGKGGVLQGKSHEKGGIPTADGQMVFEGGEAVMTQRATSMFKPILSDMNVAGGGVAFGHGGVTPIHKFQAGTITPVPIFPSQTAIEVGAGFDAESMAERIGEEIADRVSELRVINPEADITDAQISVINTETEASF